MPNAGDVVRAIERFRSNGREWGTENGIAIAVPESGSIGVIFPSGHVQRFSREYLEVVHAVNTPEAELVHAVMPMGDYHPHAWYVTALENRPEPARSLQVGDIVIRSRVSRSRSYVSEFAQGEIGRVNRLTVLGEPGIIDVSRITERLVGEGGRGSSHLLAADFDVLTPVERVVANTTVTRRSDWQPGDIVRRSEGGRGGTFIDTEELVIRDSATSPYIHVSQILADGTTQVITGRWNRENFTFIRRPTNEINTETQMPTGPIRANNLGLRVQINAPGHRSGTVGSIIPGGTTNRIRVSIDPHGLTEDFTVSQLSVLEQEPEMPPLAANWLQEHTWLNIDGATREDVNNFFELMCSKGYSDIRNRHPAYGTVNELKVHDQNGYKIGLLIQRDRSILYYRRTVPQGGNLMRDWNTILLAVGIGKAKEEPKKRAKPSLFKTLTELPKYFVLESSGKEGRDAQNTEYFRAAGFTGFAGKYILFAHNAFVGTKLKGVAEHFAKKHNAHWFTNQDSQVLERLIVNRKNMRTANHTTQRFAVDVEASTPLLTNAFLEFLTSIGYRQEDAGRTSGPYILLNGGNVGDAQPATWKYFPTKNNRSLCLNLAAGPKTANGKSGWEDATSRLGKDGVAYPVLDEDDTVRDPIIGDKVLLLDNAVTEGYPETAAELAALVQGTVYNVTATRGGRLQLDNTLLVHPDRVALQARKPGLQNGDMVKLTADYGKLVAGDVLTSFNSVFIDKAGASWNIPSPAYEPVKSDELTANLLAKYKLTLPFNATVVNTHPTLAGQRVTITDAWPLNTQQLGMWTEVTDSKDSWFELHELEIAHEGNGAKIKVVYGNTPEESKVFVNEQEVSLMELEDALAS